MNLCNIDPIMLMSIIIVLYLPPKSISFARFNSPKERRLRRNSQIGMSKKVLTLPSQKTGARYCSLRKMLKYYSGFS